MRYTFHKQRVHIHFKQTLHLTYDDDNKYVYYKKNKGDWKNHTNFNDQFLNLLDMLLINKKQQIYYRQNTINHIHISTTPLNV